MAAATIVGAAGLSVGLGTAVSGASPAPAAVHAAQVAGSPEGPDAPSAPRTDPSGATGAVRTPGSEATRGGDGDARTPDAHHRPDMPTSAHPSRETGSAQTTTAGDARER